MEEGRERRGEGGGEREKGTKGEFKGGRLKEKQIKHNTYMYMYICLYCHVYLLIVLSGHFVREYDMCVAAVRLVQLITRQQAVIRNIQANTITGHSHATLW